MTSSNEHEQVRDDLMDLATGRLAGPRTQEVHEHLRVCPECRGELEFLRRLVDDVEAQGARHLRPDRLVDLSLDAGPALEPVEAAHLEGCPSCRDELAWARRTAGVPDPASWKTALEPETIASRTARWLRGLSQAGRPGWIWASAGLVAAAAVILILLVHASSRPGSRLEDLAMVERLPAEEPTLRGGSAAPDARLFAQALHAYAGADYQRASTLFGEVTAARPDHPEAWLYLGSSLLLLRRPSDAVPALTRAVAQARTTQVQEESSWQLAQAELLLGDAAAARTALARVRDLHGRHNAQAGRLAGRLSHISGAR